MYTSLLEENERQQVLVTKKWVQSVRPRAHAIAEQQEPWLQMFLSSGTHVDGQTVMDMFHKAQPDKPRMLECVENSMSRPKSIRCC